MPEPENFAMSIREIAARLGVSERTIRRWSRTGRFPRPVRLGPKLLRWDRAAFRRWCKEQNPLET